MKTKITEFSVTCYGPQWPDYFQGHGTGPKWDGALLGAGSSRKEAVEDLRGIVEEDGLKIPGLVTAIKRATADGARCRLSKGGGHMETYYIGLNWLESDNYADMTNKQIRECFREADDSHLWPIRGKFSAVERAIREARKWEGESGISLEGMEYANFLDDAISRIVNNEKNW